MTVPRKQKPNSVPRIDADYISVMASAVRLHRPCASLESVLRGVLSDLENAGIRAPNDWQFAYNQCVELRWYDGHGEHLGGSSKSVSLHIHADHASISGRLSKSYDGGSHMRVDGMQLDDAVVALNVFVNIVDSPQDTKGKS